MPANTLYQKYLLRGDYHLSIKRFFYPIYFQVEEIGVR